MTTTMVKWVGEQLVGSLGVPRKSAESFADGAATEELETFFKSATKGDCLFFMKDDHGNVTLETGPIDNVRLNNEKCMYLMKMTDKPLKKSDEGVLVGDLSKAKMLYVVETTISKLYHQKMKSANAWGMLKDAGTQAGFLKKQTVFTACLRRNIQNLETSIELPLPPCPWEDLALDDNYDEILADKDALKAIRSIIAKWIENIQAHLDLDPSMTLPLMAVEHEVKSGPQAEIDFWSQRVLALSKAVEKLNSEPYLAAIAVLQRDAEKVRAERDDDHERMGRITGMSNTSPMRSGNTRGALSNRSQTSQFSRPATSQKDWTSTDFCADELFNEWRKTDILITDKLNEAKDNSKFLENLRPYIEPVYTEQPDTIAEALPGLFANLKMILTLSRHYCNATRMTNLMCRITSQMVNRCSEYIYKGRPYKSIWQDKPEDVIEKLRKCIRLFNRFKQIYQETQTRLEEMPKGKQFFFDSGLIFGQFEKYGRRLEKLIDMFSSIQQFSLLESQHVDGLQEITAAFFKLTKQFEKKGHDLLDHTATAFERDFVEFTMHNSALENKIQSFIDTALGTTKSSNIDQSLDLLTKFKKILHREALQDDLNHKYMQIFRSYGKQLIQIKEIYEQNKHNPPLGRNVTKIAGSILWSRQLLRRITGPMEKFKSNPRVFHPKESRKIVKDYNRIARTLIEFETVYFNAWCQTCENAKKRLQARLIVQHKSSRELFANFDRRILELVREGKFLMGMGFDIPQAAKIVLLLQTKLKTYFSKVMETTDLYNKMIRCTSPNIKNIIHPHIAALRKKLMPGLTTVSWTSMTIEKYVIDIEKAITQLSNLILRVNDILENRVRKNFRYIAALRLVDAPVNVSFNLDEFVHTQQTMIRKSTKILIQKNEEVHNAIEDLIRDVKEFPLQDENVITPEEEFNKVRYYYQTMVYHSILCCIKKSLNSLKSRASSRSQKLFLLETALFDVNLTLQVPTVKVVPTLDDVQDALNDAAKKMIHCTKEIYDWGVTQDGNSHDPVPYFNMLSCDKNIVIVLLLLTGAVQDTHRYVKEHLKVYMEYDWMWKQEPEDAYNIFVQEKRTPGEYIERLEWIVAVEQKIDAFPAVETIAAFNLKTAGLQLQLKHECGRWKYKFSEKIHQEVKQDLDEKTALLKGLLSRLQREIKDITGLKYVIETLGEVRDLESWIQMDFLSIFQRYEILEKYLPAKAFTKIEMDNKAMVTLLWKNLQSHAEKVRDEVSGLEERFKGVLIKEIKLFGNDSSDFITAYENEGPMVPNIKPREAMTRLNKFSREFETLDRKYELYNSGEKLFGLARQEYPSLAKTKSELVLLKSLYGLFMSVINTLEEYKSNPWNSLTLSIDTWRGTLEQFESRSKKLPKACKQWDSYKELHKTIADFIEILPLLEQMSKPSIQPRHWQQISEVTGKEFNTKLFDDLKLSQVLEADILEFAEDIEEICDGADKQLKIEKELKDIREIWEVQEIAFAPFKQRGDVILKGDVVKGVVEMLEETMANLNQMLTMKHVKPFKEEAEDLLRTLSDVNDMMERWIKLQQLWMSLESVFTSGDIARQMPQDTLIFRKVDKEWISRFIFKAKELTKVVSCCTNEYMKNILPSMMEDLERCQKALDGYLENKRNAFPRFYFVSNPALLLILSQGSDKVAVQSCFAKVFDAISRVQFDKDNVVAIETETAGYSGVRDVETLKFSRHINTNGNIEEWLTQLEREMRRTMHREINKVYKDITIMTIDEILKKHCAQCSLLAIQFIWTTTIESALEKCRVEKEVMQQVTNSQNELLTTLANITTGDIKRKMDRRNVETLVTIQVHNLDVIKHLNQLWKQKRLKSAADFEWQKQLRCYWNDEDRICIVQISDVPFTYCWEYLGCKERLVVTPLTDRCYITIAQACGMIFGGAPAGPAGTGKTETVKDLGRALGKYVVVFNCSDQMRYRDTAKLFKGLCQSGSWGCFDEFNRIELEVLSVVAQQVMAVLSAIRARTKTFYFPGDLNTEITLDKRCGFFITMNPGYAGRQELPENIKSQFRSVAMMVPDCEIIIKVKLASVGYLSFEMLSRKFATLYQLCKEQLSKQRHYDFGLRNILSVLRTAGANLRVELKKGLQGTRSNLEEMLMMRTLRDMNLAKLVGDDVGLFISLLHDLFPGQPDPQKASYKEVEDALDIAIEKAKMQKHMSWVAKIMQLYETSNVRHGLMMIGPAGGGKTVAIRMLIAALEKVISKKHVEVRMNPKAITAQEMFGENDLVSGEWTDGVFSSIWSKYNDISKNQVTWIVCDGPVDTLWIENLNTVLDDNKLLTLANGDRLPMTDNVKILFEAEDLRNASPATVSRAGIIFVDSRDLGFKPLVDTWMDLRRAEEKKHLIALYQELIVESEIFEWMKKNITYVFPSTNSHLVTNMLALLDALLEDSVTKQIVLPKDVLGKYFLYAIVWSIGGLLERENQFKFYDVVAKFYEASFPGLLPPVQENETAYEYFVGDSNDWELWAAPQWKYPETFKFSEILIPTQDSVRVDYILQKLAKEKDYPSLVLGSAGTGKTSTVKQFFSNLPSSKFMAKTINFSSATSCKMFQDNIEADIEKRQGKTFAPPRGKYMMVLLDGVSMPEVNPWGDQPTLEIVRELVEYRGMMFLEKDKRGDRKIIDCLSFVGAMTHPGGGRNDIPNRLKRHFYAFNLTPPSKVSIDNIYGQMLRGRFEAQPSCLEIIPTITRATIQIWDDVKAKMLPTPSKFHYIFNMFDLSRVFQGVLFPPVDVITDEHVLIDLWKHECARVFCDKLVSLTDQGWYNDNVEDLMIKEFGAEMAEKHKDPAYFVDFLRDDVIDPETDEIAELAPKIYERGPSFDKITERVHMFLNKYNNTPKKKAMPLVLFIDAVKHLMRMSRVLAMPKSHCLFVGVGGSGRQSLTRLASYMARHQLYRIELTRTYKTADFLDDIKKMCTLAGKDGTGVTFLFSDADIIFEDFLEYINMLLATGMITGLFAKEERDMMAAELRPIAKNQLKGFDDSHQQLIDFLMTRIRENFHIVLAFSPANNKFAERARKFPSLISGTTINWFLRWPEDALKNVSMKFIREDKDFNLNCEEEIQANLVTHIANVHDIVVNSCDNYFTKFRRHVYVTPKSYLSFINMYKEVYKQKSCEVKQKADNVKMGLEKIAKASEDVELMKVKLAEQKIVLANAEVENAKMAVELSKGSKVALAQKSEAQKIEKSCTETADRINVENEEANKDLQKAMPKLEAAKKAAATLKKNDINEIAGLPAPHDLIKRIVDVISILLHKPLAKVQSMEIKVFRAYQPFIKDSYTEYGLKMMSDVKFIPTLLEFVKSKKDQINEETMELIEPYYICEDFTGPEAKKKSSAAEGMCNFCRAMYEYHQAALVVAPKKKMLAIKQAELEESLVKLRAAQAASQKAQDTVDDMKKQFTKCVADKTRIEENAKATEDKAIAATHLIDSLAGEQLRWKEDEKTFAIEQRQLLGDVVLASAFVSYCGPFNQFYRKKLITQDFYSDCSKNNVPVTPGLNVNKFLTDDATVAEWNSQLLPKDELSIQNGILVTQATRWPLLIDPQGQGTKWLKEREKDNLPYFGTTFINVKRLRDQLKYGMQEGKAFIIEGVEEELDPMLDPVLEKNFFKQGRTIYIKLGDEDAEFDPKFRMILITKLGNPHFSPELSAKTTVVDFSVTQKGLEDQLLSIVVNEEQKSLEEQRLKLVEDINANTISLVKLDKLLLKKLSEGEGDLLEDAELINVLNETKQKSVEVNAKIESSGQTQIIINKKREQYRSVATRGSVLYFVIVDMSLVNWMYQTSLAQFLKWFIHSLRSSAKANLVTTRVSNIIEFMTYDVYDNVNRGLFRIDKSIFKIMCCIRMCTTAEVLGSNEVGCFLKGGSVMSKKECGRKTLDWLAQDAWMNLIASTKTIDLFRDVPSLIDANEKEWKKWYDEESPEMSLIPDLEERLQQHKLGPFHRMHLIRCLRPDRTLLAANGFITGVMGPKFVQPQNVTMEEIWASADMNTPLILMLTPGADPTGTLKALGRKKNVTINIVSMGEGQEIYATKAITDGLEQGGWALLQNCHLGLGFMADLPENLKKWTKDLKTSDDFRLWITCEANDQFPISLLQMSIKVTQETPQGIQAGMLRLYKTMVNPDRLARVDKKEWRDLVYCICFLHCIVQERRKFGALGWNIPYEYNESDLEASLMFLEKHMFSSPQVNWPTLKYMICEANYGGRITDDMDRRLFNTFGDAWLNDGIFLSEFVFATIPKTGYEYKIPEVEECEGYIEHCQGFPVNDSPEVFGLHPNADLTYGTNVTRHLLNTIMDTQPKESSSGGGKTREEIVKDSCRDMLDRMVKLKYKDEFVRDDIRKRPKAELEFVLQRKDIKGVDGFTIPLNVFLYQEIVRLSYIINMVRSTLENLILAIDGVVIMTPALMIALNAIFDAKPPMYWYIDASGAQIAWTTPNLGGWFQGLLDRDSQLKNWLKDGRPTVYWMTGFFNPQGFLTAMKQEVTRKHKAERWALDDMVYKTTILDEFDPKRVRSPSDDGGVYIQGLFLDGCSWDVKGKCLTESAPKELFTPLPIILVSATQNKRANDEGRGGKLKAPYPCPVYTVPKRTDLNYIFSINIPSKKVAMHWILRGVAITAATQ